MDLKLAGKTALITGGSKGIGRAAADILAGEGCNVIIVSRSADALAAAKSAIAQKPTCALIRWPLICPTAPTSKSLLAIIRARYPGEQCRRHSRRFAAQRR